MRVKSLAAFVIAVVLLGVVAANASASAQQPPVLPCAFYGNVTIDGAPAPAGTEIVAKIGDEIRGSITVTEPGRYGGAGALDPKLIVIGNTSDEGKNITFYVNGIKAEQTAVWQSGGVFKLDLSVKTQTPSPSPGISGFEVLLSLVALAIALFAARGRESL
ncbi:MAG: PKD repeat domain protein [Candidatus Alkanophagales archaeon MCA70_species_1]|nr:PKD repeat domain protein [Candidatus Alkanophaga volatiphilum]